MPILRQISIKFCRHLVIIFTRTQQAYGQTSAINKLLIINAEAQPGRITIVLVKQQPGF